MNRLKKEDIKRFKEYTKNMNQKDIESYRLLLDLQENFDFLTRNLKAEFFQEEIDWYYDDSFDSSRRKNGENPMRPDYIEKMNNKRIELGFLPLSQNGFAQDEKKTYEYCQNLITKKIEFKALYGAENKVLLDLQNRFDELVKKLYENLFKDENTSEKDKDLDYCKKLILKEIEFKK